MAKQNPAHDPHFSCDSYWTPPPLRPLEMAELGGMELHKTGKLGLQE